ncbi:MAG: TIM-barrel domain-containing protein [Polyangia bacterium]
MQRFPGWAILMMGAAGLLVSCSGGNSKSDGSVAGAGGKSGVATGASAGATSSGGQSSATVAGGSSSAGSGGSTGTTGGTTSASAGSGGASSSSSSAGSGGGASSSGGTTSAGGSRTGGAGGTAGSGGVTASGGGGTAGSGTGTVTAGSGGSTGGSGGGGAGGAPTTGGGLSLSVGGGTLKIEVCADNVIRVAFATSTTFFTRASLTTAAKQCVPTSFTTTTAGNLTKITTDKLTVQVDTTTGQVTFLDPTGQTILAENTAGGRTLTAATINGEATTSVRQEWAPNANESLYGLGQHQHGLIDIKNTDLDLHQYNTEVYIPYLVSSNGYGILWDNTSFTRFGDLTNAVPLPGVTGLYSTSGSAVPGDVNPGNGTVNWTGTITPTVTGDYTFRTYSSSTIQLTVNNQMVINHWRQNWLPNEDIAHVTLTAGQAVPINLQWIGEGVNIIRLLWKPPVANRTTSFWSQVADGTDYYFVYGPELDDVVAGYRLLTGQVPMMPQWAYGFWQCREHYETAQEITDVLEGYRSRNAPIDNIVQDWQYWVANQWGSHQFDLTRYPDPAGMVNTIHNTYNAHFMISVWPKFYPTTANYVALNAQGYVYTPNITQGIKDFLGNNFTFYDAFSSGARTMYWSQINTALFTLGIDAWWLDATEPEIVEGPYTSISSQVTTNQTHMNPTALGSGSRMLDAYALVNSQAVYQGQRAAAPNQRVFILTRNGFAGQQRYAAATWSGDISSTWTAMKKQIPAGLGFAVSGMPYWTLDSGGFAVPTRFSVANPTAADTAEWQEMNARWFEFSTFLPILRVHGQAPYREMWEFGGDTSAAYAAMLKFDKLRYNMLPYIYSLAGAVTQHAGTIMRPLVMDFRSDTTARETGDEYMFGPAFLVAPVTTYQATTRSVYLPTTPGGWYLFWTGAPVAGGATVAAAPAPFDAMPVYVRAGSIVPLGPDLQYSSEKPEDPITFYVYAGADGAFTLYEDQGTTNDYETGAFSQIPLTWTDATNTLSIGARQGSFTGMLASRTFQVVLIDSGKAVGYPSTATPDKTVTYTGAAVAVTLN